jgi:hypothetical protein
MAIFDYSKSPKILEEIGYELGPVSARALLLD